VRDVESGIYFDPERMHVLGHKGKYLSVRGPLNIARPVQGWPVIVQAGASEAGRQLAAETAEVVFAAGGNLEAARPSTPTSKAGWRLGRDPDGMKILPGAWWWSATRSRRPRPSAPTSTAWSTTTAASPA
jgi:alkanesulfonate monooxygenase SsuD/methylene tetrahydromethanopterin reductase-like flavin-dependent oxidoreductase (luciferase family)